MLANRESPAAGAGRYSCALEITRCLFVVSPLGGGRPPPESGTTNQIAFALLGACKIEPTLPAGSHSFSLLCHRRHFFRLCGKPARVCLPKIRGTGTHRSAPGPWTARPRPGPDR